MHHIRKSHLKTVWLIIFISLTLVAGGRSCLLSNSSSHKRESRSTSIHKFCGKVDNPCYGRGICKRVGESYDCICHSNLYKGKNCTEEVKHCSSSPCQNGGTCVEAQGTFFCICPASNHGTKCEISAGGLKRASKPIIWYKKEIQITFVSMFLAIMDNLGTDISLEFSAGDGLKFKLVEKHFTYQSNVRKYANDNKIISNEISEGPGYVSLFYNQYNKVENFYMNIAFYNKKYLLLDTTLPLVLHPLYGKCVPEIILQRCGSSTASSANYFGAMKLTFTSEVISGCPDTVLSYSWKVYQLTKNFPFPSGKSEIAIPAKVDEMNLVVEPFSFKKGEYALRLTVFEEDHKDYPKSHFNVATCWFHIIRRPPNAILQGGNERTVGWNQEFSIDGSASHEPDRPPNKRYFLTYEWKCWNEKSPSDSESYCKGQGVKLQYTTSKLQVPTKVLALNDVYVFGLVVVAKPNLRSTMVTQKIHVVQGTPPLLDLICMKNCEAKCLPSKSLIYKVTCTSCAADEKITYNWDMIPAQNNKKSQMEWDSDTERGRQSDLLIIPANKLLPGDTYTFTAVGVTSIEGSSSITIEMNPNVEMGTCDVNPKEGVSALDQFSIKCEKFKDTTMENEEEAALLYQYYQEVNTKEDEDLSSSIILYYDTNPIAENLILMPGSSKNDYKTILAVKVSNHLGMYVFYNMSVKVKPFAQATNPEEFINKIEELFVQYSDVLHGSVSNLTSFGGVSGAVQMISTLAEALTGVTDSNLLERTTELRSKMREDFVEIILQMPFAAGDAIAIKMDTSLLLKVLTPWGKESLRKNPVTGREFVPVTSSTAKNAGKAISRIADALFNESSSESLYFTPEDVKEIANLLTSAGTVIIENQNEYLFREDDDWEETTDDPAEDEFEKNEDYPNYKEIDYTYQVNVGNFRQALKSYLDGISKVSDSMAYDLNTEENPIVIENENIILWTKKITPHLNEEKFGPSKSYSGAKISKSFSKNLQMSDFSAGIALEIGLFNSTPVWWQNQTVSPHPINSDVLFVNIRNLKTGETVNTGSEKSLSEKEVVHVFLALHSYEKEAVEENGENKTAVSDADEDELTVHQIQIPNGGALIVNFEPQNAEDKFLIMIQKDYRPNKNDFIDGNAYELPHKSPLIKKEDKYSVLVKGSSKVEFPEFPQLFYLAVMPHPKDNQSNKDFSYKFYAHGITCNHFVFETGKWSSEGCQVGPETTYNGIHCICSHLSLFGASLFVAPNRVNPISDIKLFLNVRENFVAVALVCTILILYIILLIFARRKDLSDQRKHTVIFLEDNVQGDTQIYIVTVYTGIRRGSGTTSNVYLRFQGIDGFSRIHNLSSKEQKILQSGGEDWFIILTPHSLGELLNVRLWHDNTGNNPSWYCSQIVIRELDGTEVIGVWVFLIQRWLTVAGMPLSVYSLGTLPCCRVKTATVSELRKWKVMIRETASRNLKEKHLWFSIFTRPANSTFKSTQRLSVAVCVLLSTMLVNLMFYGLPKGGPSDQLDVGKFKIATKELMISIQSLFITTIINLPIVMLFKLSDPSDYKIVDLLQNKKNASSSNATDKLQLEKIRTKIESDIVHQEVPNEKSQSQKKKKEEKYLLPNWCRLIAWSLCSFMIFMCSYLICLYGLSFGKVKSLRWVSSILIAILHSIIIIQPLKIIAFAAVESFMEKVRGLNAGHLKKIENFDEIDKKIGEEREGHKKTGQQKVDTSKAMKVTFSPMSVKEASILGQKEIQWREKCSQSKDVFALLFYIVSLYVIAYNAGDPLAWYNANVLEQILINGMHNQGEIGPHVESTITQQDMLDYINYTVLPSLHAFVGYSDERLPTDKGWSAHLPSKLLGAPRLRQIRVQSATCHLPGELNEWAGDRICLPSYSEGTADKSDYDVGWRPASNLTDRKERSQMLWNYHTHEEAEALSTIGELHTYPGDGYPMDLGRNLNNSRRILQYLWDAGWIDRFTRALFLEFTIYNADQNLFSTVTVLVERSPVGIFLTSHNIITSRLLVIHFGDEKFGIISYTIFILAVLFLFWRLCRRLYLSKVYHSTSTQNGEEKPPSKLERILLIIMTPRGRGIKNDYSRWEKIKRVIKYDSYEFYNPTPESNLKGLLGKDKKNEVSDPKLLLSTPAYPLHPLKPPSYMEWFLILLTVIIVFVYIQRTKAVHEPLQRLDEGAAANERHKFVSLIHGLQWNTIYIYTLAASVCVATFALWQILPSFHLLPEKALLRSAKGPLPSMMIAFGIVILGVGFSAYCSSLLGSSTHYFSSIRNSFSTLLVWPLGHEPAEEYLEVGLFARLFYCVFVLGCTIYIINLFITIVMEDFEITHSEMKAASKKKSKDYGIMWFLKEFRKRYLPKSFGKCNSKLRFIGDIIKGKSKGGDASMAEEGKNVPLGGKADELESEENEEPKSEDKEEPKQKEMEEPKQEEMEEPQQEEMEEPKEEEMEEPKEEEMEEPKEEEMEEPKEEEMEEPKQEDAEEPKREEKDESASEEEQKKSEKSGNLSEGESSDDDDGKSLNTRFTITDLLRLRAGGPNGKKIIGEFNCHPTFRFTKAIYIHIFDSGNVGFISREALEKSRKQDIISKNENNACFMHDQPWKQEFFDLATRQEPDRELHKILFRKVMKEELFFQHISIKD